LQEVYYYEYDLYRFSEGKFALVARSYTDRPQEAHFLGAERKAKGKWKWRSLVGDDLKTTIFEDAIQYLQQIGKSDICLLIGDGYVSLCSTQSR